MSEPSLLCLQNDLLFCMKEGKDTYLWRVLGCLCGCNVPEEAGGLVPVSAYRCSVPASAWPNPRPRPGAAREAAATRHPPSSGRCLAPCDGRTSVQRRPPLTADTLGHLHYPELGTVEYKPSHTETCVGALRGNYSCPQCSLCSFVSRQQQNLAKTFHGPYLAPRFLMYKSRIAGEKSFWVLRITLRIRDWLIF